MTDEEYERFKKAREIKELKQKYTRIRENCEKLIEKSKKYSCDFYLDAQRNDTGNEGYYSRVKFDDKELFNTLTDALLAYAVEKESEYEKQFKEI